MSRRGAFIKGGALLSAGNMSATACSFIRNIIIARMLSVEDVGVAATFAMTTSLMEMASNMAIDRLIVQAPDGDDPKLQASAQLLQFVRGLLGGLVLLAIAAPVAALFGIPDATWAFMVLAAVPVMKGLGHLDVHRVQRAMRFGPSIATALVPQIIVTLLAAPLAWWTGDFRAVLWVVLIQTFTTTLVSHLLAQRRYAWRWDPAQMRRIVSFGWPLLVNGGLMYAIFQGDRAIIGAVFSMQELGWYAVALGLTLVPSTLVPKVLTTLILPRLSQSGARAEGHSQLTMQAFFVSGVGLGVGAWTLGPLALVLIYGERYAPGAAVVGWLGAMQAMRVMKAGPATVALATAKTIAPLLANVVRLSGLGLAIAAVSAGYGVVEVAIAGVIGEALSLVASLWLLRMSGVSGARAARGAVTAWGIMAIAIGAWEWLAPSGAVAVGGVGIALCLLAVGGAGLAMGEIRSRLFRSRVVRADTPASRGGGHASLSGDGGASR